MGGYDSRASVQCPRCYEQCGWCSDPRFMHGQLKLSGSRKKCTVAGYEPEGDGCPMCGGSKTVVRTITYEPRRGAECSLSYDGRHHVDTSMESGPRNCFHCERPMP
jgi:hypothetical protein